jgi:hypothetical protein
MRYFVGIDGVTAGPYDHVQLLELYQAGLIHGATQCVADDQSGAWKALTVAIPSLTRVAVTTQDSQLGTPSVGDQRVRVADVEMKFGSMMVFMIKWVFASIPAAIIVIVVLFILSAVLGGIFAGLLGGLRGIK